MPAKVSDSARAIVTAGCGGREPVGPGNVKPDRVAKEDVDSLVTAGPDALRVNPVFREFLTSTSGKRMTTRPRQIGKLVFP
jgi:hypothetical protein